jgi:hypothetical protein
VALTDVAGDGDFPELQGYFPLRDTGHLYFHFAFLTTDVEEELNIALAGPRHFVAKKDGIAFWLATRKGLLVHHSDGQFRRLGPVEAFIWYTVDVVYDLDAGSYALSVKREGDRVPIFALQGQRNAANQPGSAVDKFSFVGAPFSDQSNVTYYVDDIALGTDLEVTQRPFVAPGRRKLFLDLFTRYQLRLLEKPRCLPVEDPADLGLEAKDLAGKAIDVAALLAGQGSRSAALVPIAHWSQGCRALENDEPEAALQAFARAEKARPTGPMYTLSAVLALTRLKRFGEAEDRLAALSGTWRDDARYAVASAYVGLQRGDLERAEEWLRAPADRLLVSSEVLAAQARAAEQYFYVLIWQSRFDFARAYAQRLVERLAHAELPTSLWYERAGDAAFYGKDLEVAREMYTAAEKGDPGASLFLKEADLAYLGGDLARERFLREHYYGRLVED